MSDENTNWLLEPFSGLTVKNVSLDDTGAYECIGTMNNVTTRKYFKLIVSGTFTMREIDDIMNAVMALFGEDRNRTGSIGRR